MTGAERGVETHLGFATCIKLEPSEERLSLVERGDCRVSQLGHHLRAVVLRFKHGYMDDIDSVYRWGRRVVLPDLSIRPEIENGCNPQGFQHGFAWKVKYTLNHEDN